tara:strand:- start:50475 stop:50639 length:165 start_codon:yes stop_codon:yes gene_type:complete
MNDSDKLILWLKGFMDAIPQEATKEQWIMMEDAINDRNAELINDVVDIPGPTKR